MYGIQQLVRALMQGSITERRGFDDQKQTLFFGRFPTEGNCVRSPIPGAIPQSLRRAL